ncbi:arginine-glutamic acid dipeptide repeats protein-like [Nothobranchius furzeri]|uniref:arginine-glutamic acid dipeptide repeats protein-like n=1 Tax=Nothobranchius furzeri TaxID=105023 RepID=UPI0039047520
MGRNGLLGLALQGASSPTDPNRHLCCQNATQSMETPAHPARTQSSSITEPDGVRRHQPSPTPAEYLRPSLHLHNFWTIKDIGHPGKVGSSPSWTSPSPVMGQQRSQGLPEAPEPKSGIAACSCLLPGSIHVRTRPPRPRPDPPHGAGHPHTPSPQAPTQTHPDAMQPPGSNPWPLPRPPRGPTHNRQ